MLNSLMKKYVDIAGRIIATFLVSALGIISGAAVIGGISVAKSAALAGFTAVAHVIEKLARASLDGNLTAKEINIAFRGEEAPEDE